MRTKPLGFGIAVALVGLGVILAIVTSGRENDSTASSDNRTASESEHHDAHLDDKGYALRSLWPDGTLDVCVSGRQGAQVLENTEAAIADTFARMASTSAGESLGLSEISTRVDVQCAAEPRFDPGAPSGLGGGTSMIVEEKGPFDLYLFVYPQDTVDQLGRRWRERIYGYEVVFVEDAGAEVSQAVYATSAELNDVGMRDRLILTALGLIGPWGSDRPSIDGQCTEPEPEACSDPPWPAQ